MTKKLIAMVLVIALMAVALTSCATKLSGTYHAKGDVFGLAGADTTYQFSGSKVKITVKASVLGFEKTSEYEGTYQINDKDDGTQTITFTFEAKDADTYSGTYPFSQNKDEKTITIGILTYHKQ